MYKAIIFDFFGVLCSNVYSNWHVEHPIPTDKEEMQKEYMRSADTGEITESELFKEISKLDAETPQKVRDEWLGLSAINTELVAFVTELKGVYKIALCSNAPSPFLRDILKKNNLEHLFDEIVISSDVHLAKPDPAIFAFVLRQLGVQSGEAIFTDDSPQNIAGARSVGIKSFLFSDTKKLRADFKAHDIAG